MAESTGLLANPRYAGVGGCEELFEGDFCKDKYKCATYEIRWWRARGCWAAYDKNDNKMIMLFTILKRIEKI